MINLKVVLLGSMIKSPLTVELAGKSIQPPVMPLICAVPNQTQLFSLPGTDDHSVTYNDFQECDSSPMVYSLLVAGVTSV